MSLEQAHSSRFVTELEQALITQEGAEKIGQNSLQTQLQRASQGRLAIGLQQLRITQVAVGDEHLLARRNVPLCAAELLHHSATHMPRINTHSLPALPVTQSMTRAI